MRRRRARTGRRVPEAKRSARSPADTESPELSSDDIADLSAETELSGSKHTAKHSAQAPAGIETPELSLSAIAELCSETEPSDSQLAAKVLQLVPKKSQRSADSLWNIISKLNCVQTHRGARATGVPWDTICAVFKHLFPQIEVEKTICHHVGKSFAGSSGKDASVAARRDRQRHSSSSSSPPSWLSEAPLPKRPPRQVEAMRSRTVSSDSSSSSEVEEQTSSPLSRRRHACEAGSQKEAGAVQLRHSSRLHQVPYSPGKCRRSDDSTRRDTRPDRRAAASQKGKMTSEDAASSLKISEADLPSNTHAVCSSSKQVAGSPPRRNLEQCENPVEERSTQQIGRRPPMFQEASSHSPIARYRDNPAASMLNLFGRYPVVEIERLNFVGRSPKEASGEQVPPKTKPAKTASEKVVPFLPSCLSSSPHSNRKTMRAKAREGSDANTRGENLGRRETLQPSSASEQARRAVFVSSADVSLTDVSSSSIEASKDPLNNIEKTAVVAAKEKQSQPRKQQAVGASKGMSGAKSLTKRALDAHEKSVAADVNVTLTDKLPSSSESIEESVNITKKTAAVVANEKQREKRKRHAVGEREEMSGTKSLTERVLDAHERSVVASSSRSDPSDPSSKTNHASQKCGPSGENLQPLTSQAKERRPPEELVRSQGAPVKTVAAKNTDSGQVRGIPEVRSNTGLHDGNRSSSSASSSRPHGACSRSSQASCLDNPWSKVSKRMRFTPLQEEALVRGVMKYGTGGWKHIADEGWFDGRLSRELSDKYRNLQKYDHLSRVKERVKAKLKRGIDPMRELQDHNRSIYNTRRVCDHSARPNILPSQRVHAAALVRDTTCGGPRDSGLGDGTRDGTTKNLHPCSSATSTNAGVDVPQRPQVRDRVAAADVEGDVDPLLADQPFSSASQKHCRGESDPEPTREAKDEKARKKAVEKSDGAQPSVSGTHVQESPLNSDTDASSDDSWTTKPVKPVPKKKRRNCFFTPLEEEALVCGVLKYGPGKWSLILNEGWFAGRNVIQLSDKYRNMLMYGHWERLKRKVEKIVGTPDDPLLRLKELNKAHWRGTR
ncbi:uncharacterized protein ISCGN_009151 [Ixodes scapularis]